MWEASSGFEYVLWLIAVPATGVFCIQALLMLIGVTFDHVDLPFHHHDSDTSGYSPIFTVRNLVVFFMMFGWTGIAMIREFHAGVVATIAGSAVAGLAMMFVVTLMFYGISRMTSSGNFKADESLIGLEANVYLKIPAMRSGNGKVTVVAGGQKREFPAQTHGSEIPTNSTVRILEVHPGMLIVGSDEGAKQKTA